MIGAILAKRRIPRTFEALNDRDLDRYLEGFAEEAVLIHPGDVPGVSGRHEGIEAIRAFYERELEQFPSLRMTLKSVTVSNVFDMIGNNTVAVHWDADVTNAEGFRLLNSGVTILNIRNRKAVKMQNYVFDTGDDFRAAWGADTLEA